MPVSRGRCQGLAPRVSSSSRQAEPSKPYPASGEAARAGGCEGQELLWHGWLPGARQPPFAPQFTQLQWFGWVVRFKESICRDEFCCSAGTSDPGKRLAARERQRLTEQLQRATADKQSPQTMASHRRRQRPSLLARNISEPLSKGALFQQNQALSKPKDSLQRGEGFM